MLIIDLYNISKKPNSTAIPSNANIYGHKVYTDCLAKDDTSVIDPIVMIKDSLATLSRYNYARIDAWGRFYFITDIVLINGGVCEIHLRCDVLASFKSQIEGSTQYVLRSYSSYNGEIIDHYYPTKTKTSYSFSGLGVTYGGVSYDCMDLVSNTYVTGYFSRTISSGQFIIGVIGSNDTGITYYALNYTNFKTLLTNLMNYTPSNMNDVSTGIAKVLADPMQYITSCFWIPWAGQVSQTARTIEFGYYSVSCTAGILNASDYAHFRSYADIPKHPQASSRGVYLNASPFTTLTLHFNPFGSLILDTTKLVNASKLRIEWYYDCTKGNAEIFVFNDGTGEIAYHGYCDMLGVPIQLTQLTVNTLQTAGGLLGAVGGLLSFDIGDIFSGIGNALESQQPKVSTHGSEGSFLNYRSVTPRLYADFINIVDEDLPNVGRPLCERTALNTLSGYVQCGNASLSMYGALADENTEAISLLNSGIFIE